MTYYLYIPTISQANQLQPQNYANFNFMNSLDNTSIFIPNQEFNISETSSISQPILSDQIYFLQQPEYNFNGKLEIRENEELLMEMKEQKKRERNLSKEIESAKKNSESNLINNFFSFFSSRERSLSTVEGCVTYFSKNELQTQKLIHLFYSTIHIINARRGRKYVNRKIILSLFQVHQLSMAIPEIQQKIQKVSDVGLQELCQVFRRCSFAFYRSHCIDSVLTSKRILRVAKQEHFKKRRKVVEGLFMSK